MRLVLARVSSLAADRRPGSSSRLYTIWPPDERAEPDRVCTTPRFGRVYGNS
jgi:hypothetical protein